MSVQGGPRARPVDTVTSEDRRAMYLSRGWWTQETLVAQVRAHARARPDDEAVVDQLGARRRSFAELLADSTSVAHLLLEVGVQRGDVVAVQLPNRYEAVAIALGIFSVGAVINPMLPVYREREVSHMLRVAGTRVMFVPDSYRGHDYVRMLQRVVEAGVAVEVPVVVAFQDSSALPKGWIDLRQQIEKSGDAKVPQDFAQLASDVSELIFTSGTEAQPKAIMHTEQTTNFSVRAAWSDLGMTHEDVVWMPSPIGHSTGFNYGVRMALYHGAKLVLQDTWDGTSAAALIERERCSYTLAATTFVRDTIRGAREGGNDVSSMRLFGSGGAPVPANVVDAAAEVGMTVLRLYGSTEILVGTWNRRSSPEAKRRETDGLPISHVDVSTRDEAGREVVATEGEIYTRGPNTCVGFFNDPVRTAATFTSDGWVRSGDLAIIDSDAYLTVSGRKKEIIIRGGLNIAPREVEELLLQMPGVLAVAVVPVPHDRLGEIACACIVAGGTQSISIEAVIEFLSASGIAKYKFPERLEIVKEIPVTSTGKVQKYKLVDALMGRSHDSAHGN